MNAGILVLFLGYYMIFLEVLSALSDCFLTVKQMRLRGTFVGIPLVGHLGVWSDAIVITPMLSILTYTYGNQWSTGVIFWAVIISLVITIIACKIWADGSYKVPEALAYDGKITKAGYYHAAYTVGALAILFLFYFATDLKPTTIITISLILAGHIVLGSHIPLSIIRFRWYYWRTYRDLRSWLAIFAIWMLMVWRCSLIVN